MVTTRDTHMRLYWCQGSIPYCPTAPTTGAHTQGDDIMSNTDHKVTNPDMYGPCPDCGSEDCYDWACNAQSWREGYEAELAAEDEAATWPTADPEEDPEDTYTPADYPSMPY